MLLKNELVFYNAAILAEGPVWDSEKQSLNFVDIEQNRFHAFNPSDGSCRSYDAGSMVGAVCPCDDGRVIIPTYNGIFLYDTVTCDKVFLSNPDTRENVRFNDAKCDVKGRLLVGTLSLNGQKNAAALYAVESDGSFITLLDNVGLANGIAFSPDYKTIYFNDTYTHVVTAYDYDADKPAMTNPRVAVDMKGRAGAPDGMTSDLEGNLWVAEWGGGCVSCWEPFTGKLLCEILIPVERVSSCAFGGKDMNELFITTAMSGAKKFERFNQPMGGGIFKSVTGTQGAEHFKFKTR